MSFSKKIRDVLFGDPFGNVYPKREPPIPPVYDGRTAALRILREYISELTFYRPGGKDDLGDQKDPIAFQLPLRDIHVEWPDNEGEFRSPSIAFVGVSPANYESIGMTPYVDEKYDEKHPGNLLIWMSEYAETFAIDMWCETKQERRSVLLGIETSLSPTEQMAGLRFTMPDYYGQLVCFVIQSREIIDDDMAIQLRRKARLMVEMRFNVVAVFPVNPFEPSATIQVDVNEDTNEPVDLLEDSPPDPNDEPNIG